MKSSNEHRRGRGAMGLAQALAADRNRKTDGPRLATNPQVAQELSSFLAESLKSTSQEKAMIAQQDLLTQAIGFMDVTESVLPVLRDAMQETRDREVRKNAVRSVALIADRANQRGEPLTDPGIIEELSVVSRDADSLTRSLAAYTLGLFPIDLVRPPLTVLLSDADSITRANAAIAFARHNSLDGLPVLVDVLKSAAEQKQAVPAGDVGPIATTNSLKAIRELALLIDEATRAKIARDVEVIASRYPEARIRFEAAQTLASLRGSGK